MKKRLCIVFAALILFSSCSKYDDLNTAPTEASASTNPEIASTAAAGTAPVQQTTPKEMMRDEKWIADVLQMKKAIVTTHPDPFHYTSESMFNFYVDELVNSIPRLTDVEIALSMFQIVNSLRDAHTMLSFNSDISSQINLFPFYVDKIKGEYYITGIDERYEHVWSEIKGLRITAVNGMDIKEIDFALYNFLPSDIGSKYSMNEYIRAVFNPTYLSFLGVPILETNEVTFCEKSGETFSIIFDTLDEPNRMQKIEIIHPYNAGIDEGPRFELFTDDGNGVARINYNSCLNDKPLEFYHFILDTFELINANGYTKLVVDVRRNQGGMIDNVNQLIIAANKWIKNNESNRMYVLIGDLTFSAGVHTAYELGRLDDTVIIGSGAGGSIGCFGGPFTQHLNHSALKVNVATMARRTDKYALLPDIYAENDIDDYINGVDAAMEWVYRQ